MDHKGVKILTIHLAGTSENNLALRIHRFALALQFLHGQWRLLFGSPISRKMKILTPASSTQDLQRLLAESSNKKLAEHLPWSLPPQDTDPTLSPNSKALRPQISSHLSSALLLPLRGVDTSPSPDWIADFGNVSPIRPGQTRRD
jgi:hypothetical protein